MKDYALIHFSQETARSETEWGAWGHVQGLTASWQEEEQTAEHTRRSRQGEGILSALSELLLEAQEKRDDGGERGRVQGRRRGRERERGSERERGREREREGSRGRDEDTNRNEDQDIVEWRDHTRTRNDERESEDRRNSDTQNRNFGRFSDRDSALGSTRGSRQGRQLGGFAGGGVGGVGGVGGGGGGGVADCKTTGYETRTREQCEEIFETECKFVQVSCLLLF